MAMIDTLRKRASLLGFDLPYADMLPIADGSFDQGDRQHFLGMYSGLLAEQLNEVVDECFTARPRGEVFSSPFRGSVFSAEDR